ncbi:hypothetical protein B4Q04_00380 [Zobellia sp. OII3]|nr:hypothetical protein B4Q04_00380 [Zobellia sp. OII3]
MGKYLLDRRIHKTNQIMENTENQLNRRKILKAFDLGFASGVLGLFGNANAIVQIKKCPPFPMKMGCKLKLPKCVQF